MSETPILDESAVSEIEARYKLASKVFPYREVNDSLDDIPALCRTVKHLLAENEHLRSELNGSAESIINEAGKVGQLMDLASASARKEERAAIKSVLQDYFKHFFCTCHGSTRTDGHFASCPITIRDEVLGRLQELQALANSEEVR